MMDLVCFRSINDELAIMLMVLQSLVVLILIMLLSFGVVAIIYESVS